MTDDPDRETKAANLFDLRRVIGALLCVYGVMLTIAGITDSDAAVEQAAGLRINLIAGIGLLVLGGLFLVWGFLRPLGKELAQRDPSEETPDH
jgi:drug/metabolite transporter (DMT)-like permease